MQPINCRDLSAKEIVDYIIELNPDLRDVKKQKKGLCRGNWKY